jgi:hypothetical protein
VFRPLFHTDGDAIFISGYEVVTNASAVLSDRILSLNVPAHRAQLATTARAIVYDVPFIFGAKKGLPNFNEFSLRNVAQVTRKQGAQADAGRPAALPDQLDVLADLDQPVRHRAVELVHQPFSASGPGAGDRQFLTRAGGWPADEHPARLDQSSVQHQLRCCELASNRFLLPVQHPVTLANTMVYSPAPLGLAPATVNTPLPRARDSTSRNGLSKAPTTSSAPSWMKALGTCSIW